MFKKNLTKKQLRQIEELKRDFQAFCMKRRENESFGK